MKCSLGEEKGSEISGKLNEWSTGKAELVGENRGRESKRTASRRVGWKGPPCRSSWKRCVGRTWPRTKKVDIALWFGLVRSDSRCFWGRGRTDRALVFKDDVVATKRPAVVTGVEMVAEG